MANFLGYFEAARPFTEHEAWLLFRVAALAEAGGWTMLITGLALKQYVLHGNNVPVLIAGQIHGMIFFAYIIAALGLYPSLGWTRYKAIIAGLASVPPYGSLLFERWEARQRRHKALRNYHACTLYTALMLNDPQY
ncbi:MAG TPA: DUF3817 domain-containing protein [Candidatus Saccharimonadales bacterium]